MKRVFGKVESAFDILYLCSAFIMGIILIMNSSLNLRMLAGVMALILAVGDSFHLIPRIRVIISKNEKALRPALGRGKQITSVFYDNILSSALANRTSVKYYSGISGVELFDLYHGCCAYCHLSSSGKPMGRDSSSGGVGNIS